MTVFEFIMEQNENARMGFMTCKESAYAVLDHLYETCGTNEPRVMDAFMLVTEAYYVSAGYDEIMHRTI